MIAELLGAETAQRVQLALEYAPAPPFQSGTPQEAPAEIVQAVRERFSASRKAREAIIARITAA